MSGESTQVLRRHPAFRRFWAATTISYVGSEITVLALPLTASILLDAEPYQFGLLTAAGLLPLLLLGMPVGLWVDRVSHRVLLLVAADLARCGLLALVPLAAATDHLSMELLFAVATCAGIAGTVVGPASTVLLPTLLPPAAIPAGNARLHTSLWTAIVIGPGAAGLLVQLVSAPVAITADAVSYAVSAVLLLTLRAAEPKVAAPEGRPGWREMTEGVRETCRNPGLRAMAGAYATINVGWFMAYALMVPYATGDLGMSAGQLGLVRLCIGFGGIAGALCAGRLILRHGTGPVFVMTSVCYGLAVLVWPLAGGPPWVAMLMLGAGEVVLYVAMGASGVANASLLIELTAPDLRGRVSSGFAMLTQGAKPVGALLGGSLGSLIGLRPTLAIAAAIAIACPFWTWRSPLRQRTAVAAAT